MKLLKILAVAAIIALAAVLGFAYSGLYDVSATTPHSGAVSWLLATTSHASVERRSKGIDVPDLDDSALALAGVNDFDSMCVSCHGAPGKEPGAIGKGLNPAAPDLAESAMEMQPAELFWVTKNGIKMTGMPAWGKTHSDDDLWPLVALITQLPKLDADAYQALLASGAGSGHHADPMAEPHAPDDVASDSVPETGEHEDQAHSDQSEFQDIDSAAEQQTSEPEPHDPSTHEH